MIIFSASRETSPTRVPEKATAHQNGYTNGHSYENGNGVHLQNGFSNNADHSDDEYIDTVEDDSGLMDEQSIHFSRPWTRRSRSQLHEDGPGRNSSNDLNVSMNQLLKTVESMRTDMQQINTRINILERSLTEVKNQQLRKKVKTHIECIAKEKHFSQPIISSTDYGVEASKMVAFY